jgi:hypothetical protein
MSFIVGQLFDIVTLKTKQILFRHKNRKQLLRKIRKLKGETANSGKKPNRRSNSNLPILQGPSLISRSLKHTQGGVRKNDSNIKAKQI